MCTQRYSIWTSYRLHSLYTAQLSGNIGNGVTMKYELTSVQAVMRSSVKGEDGVNLCSCDSKTQTDIVVLCRLHFGFQQLSNTDGWATGTDSRPVE